MLALADALLGVVPNCDAYLEIWPTAFRSYDVMFPNLVNLPFMPWGLGAPRSTIGLAIYVASRSAGCAYCSAHTCTFALRRGATVDEVASALEGDGAKLSASDRAAVRVARALSVVPARISDDDRLELRRHFSPADGTCRESSRRTPRRLPSTASRRRSASSAIAARSERSR